MARKQRIEVTSIADVSLIELLIDDGTREMRVRLTESTAADLSISLLEALRALKAKK